MKSRVRYLLLEPFSIFRVWLVVFAAHLLSAVFSVGWVIYQYGFPRLQEATGDLLLFLLLFLGLSLPLALILTPYLNLVYWLFAHFNRWLGRKRAKIRRKLIDEF